MQAKHRILLADDSLTMHRAVKLALEGDGNFEVATVDNGEDALRLAEETRPHLVLADLDMPGLTGAQLTSALKNHHSLNTTKVILLCSSFDGYSEAEVERIPADSKIWKPFEASQLLALVKKTLKESEKIPEGLTIERLGDPIFSHSDLAKALTDETFQTAAPVAAPAENYSEELPVNTAGDQTYEASSETDNLWGVPDDEPMNLYSPPSLTDYSTESPSLVQDTSSEFEVIGSDNPAPSSPDFSHEAQTQILQNAPGTESRITEPLSFEVSDFSNYESPESEIPHLASGDEILAPNPSWSPAIENAASLGGFSETEIRTMIREEIREALGGWLKKKLEDELSQVMAEIDRS